MIAPALLLFASTAGLVAALALPEGADFVLIAAPATLASLVLLIHAARPRRARTGLVILDGSNVMHWQAGTPMLETLRAVLDAARAHGMTPGVVFDANAGYLLFGSYMGDRGFARLLNLPRERVMVVEKGTPADPAILTAARDLGARVITNDRYRDWVEQFPQLATPGHLIPGRILDGAVMLEVG